MPTSGGISHDLTMRTTGVGIGRFEFSWANLLSTATLPSAGGCGTSEGLLIVSKRPPANVFDLVTGEVSADYAKTPAGNALPVSDWLPSGSPAFATGEPVIVYTIRAVAFAFALQFAVNLRTGATAQALAFVWTGSSTLYTQAEIDANIDPSNSFQNIAATASASIAWAGCVPTVTLAGSFTDRWYLDGVLHRRETFTLTSFAHTITGLTNV